MSSSYVGTEVRPRALRPTVINETNEVTILAPSQNFLLLKQVKEFAQAASEAAARADETGVVDQGVWSAFHDSGLSMAAFDPALGGSGLCEPSQHNTLCSILRLIGGANLSVARLFEGHVNAVMLVSRYGTVAQIESLAGSVKDGGLSGVWGAEDANGLRRIRCGESWSLEGRKILASGAWSIRPTFCR